MPGSSDHLLINLTFELPLYKRSSTLKRIINYKKADFPAVRIGLLQLYSLFASNFFRDLLKKNENSLREHSWSSERQYSANLLPRK